MLIKGTFVSQPSGSLGGITASHGRSGTYLRARVVPVNPNTVWQQAVRNIAGNLATAWVTQLTSVQREAWEAYAAQVAMTNAVGDTIYLTGLNHFLRSNTPRIQAGLARVDDGPTIYALTDMTLPVMSISEATQQSSIAYTDTDDWANEVGGFLMSSLSRPKNVTINYFKGPYRYTDVTLGAASPPTSPEVGTVPFPVVAFQRVYALIRCGLADGRLSQPVRIVTLVES